MSGRIGVSTGVLYAVDEWKEFGLPRAIVEKDPGRFATGHVQVSFQAFLAPAFSATAELPTRRKIYGRKIAFKGENNAISKTKRTYNKVKIAKAVK